LQLPPAGEAHCLGAGEPARHSLSKLSSAVGSAHAACAASSAATAMAAPPQHTVSGCTAGRHAATTGRRTPQCLCCWFLFRAVHWQRSRQPAAGIPRQRQLTAVRQRRTAAAPWQPSTQPLLGPQCVAPSTEPHREQAPRLLKQIIQVVSQRACPHQWEVACMHACMRGWVEGGAGVEARN